MNATAPIAPLLRTEAADRAPCRHGRRAARPRTHAGLGSQFNEFPLGIQAGIAVLASSGSCAAAKETGPLTGWRLWLAGLACALGVRWQYGYWFGRSRALPSSPCWCRLKWLETRSERDERMVAALALFLLTAVFCADRRRCTRWRCSLGPDWYCLPALGSHSPPSRGCRPTSRRATPLERWPGRFRSRCSSSCWCRASPGRCGGCPPMPRRQNGLVGDAGSSIAQLARSGEIAFVVEVQEGELPAARYWRGPVLEVYDGRSWKPSPGARRTLRSKPRRGRPLRYRSLQEPSDLPWIFTLERTHALSGAVEVEHPLRPDPGAPAGLLLQRTRFTGEGTLRRPPPEP